MPFNGAGLFVRVRNWVADAAAGIKIRADYHDIEDDGFADGLSQCIARDGQSVVLNNIPMNSKRLVSLSDPINPQDASTKAYADTKLPLTGDSTITGNLTVTGMVGAAGYKTRTGTPGPFGANFFNFNWTGSALNAWVDNSNIGTMATTAYVEQRASDWAHAIADPKVNRAGDAMTGLLQTAVSGNIGSAGGMNSLWVNGAAGDWAAITFYSPGSFGANFGMHPNGDFYCGGWSFGAGRAYKFWTERNLNPVQSVRLAGYGGGAVCTGVGSFVTGGGITAINSLQMNTLQYLTPGGWVTVGG